MPIIAPSLLSANFLALQKDCDMLNNSEAEWFHLDVMDGRFVPNISFGIPVIQSIRKATKLCFETHLMINTPDNLLDAFAHAGSDSLIVHAENTPHLHRTIQHIKGLGKKAGVALNPATPLVVLEEILPKLDLVLIMTVNPGFGGQKFLPETLDKIRRLNAIIKQKNLAIEIEVDGGIDAQTAPLVVTAGAGVLVAGSAIFGDKGGIDFATKKILSSIV
jgi:ribulose-phosphate 3-epimerase